jgi:hypothetical protein
MTPRMSRRANVPPWYFPRHCNFVDRSVGVVAACVAVFWQSKSLYSASLSVSPVRMRSA